MPLLKIRDGSGLLSLLDSDPDPLSPLRLRNAGVAGSIVYDMKKRAISIDASPSNIEAIERLFGSGLRIDRIGGGTPAGEPRKLNRPLFKGGVREFLMPDQKRVILEALSREGKEYPCHAIFAVPGAGKTLDAIEIASHLWSAGEIDALLIITKPGVHIRWIDDQVTRWMPPEVPWRAEVWRIRKMFSSEGFNPKQDFLDIFSINHDSARTDNGHTTISALIERYQGRVLCVVDESHYIKNRYSGRSDAISDLATRCYYRIIMTGTPYAKGLEDVWGQFFALDPRIIGHRFKTSFRAQYTILGGFGNKHVVGYRNLETFQEKIAPYVSIVDKLDLKEKRYVEVPFELHESQSKAIRNIKDGLAAELRSIKDEPIKVQIKRKGRAGAALTRAQQISNGFAYDKESGVTKMLSHNPRIAALVDLVKQFPEDQQAIIWCRFLLDVDVISDAFKKEKLSFATIAGGSGKDDAKISSFLNDPTYGPNKRPQFLVATYAMAEGYNLQVGGCHCAIYYSNVFFNALTRWQSEDRIYRTGQKEGVVIYDLIGRGSIDRGILANLRSKKDEAKMVIGGLKDGRKFTEALSETDDASLSIDDIIQIIEMEEV